MKPTENEATSPKSAPRPVVSWFEIPVLNMNRAVGFYSRVFSIKMELAGNGEHAMAFFPNPAGEVGGALVAGRGCTPSGTGTLVYLNAGHDLSHSLIHVADAGGRVVMGKTALGEAGFFAIIIDTEGNKVALHSKS